MMASSGEEKDEDEPSYDLVNYRGLFLLNNIIKMLPAIQAIKGRPDDILVTSFPKSGTTWTQAMVQLIVYGRVGKITALGMNDQWCFLDLAYHKSPMPVELVEEQASPRLLKTHFPWQFIPASILHSKCKIIYIYRNPKDVMVSLYHFCKNLPLLQQSCPHQSFQSFVEAFINDRVIYAPYFENLASFWAHRHHHNLLLLSYENLHRDAHGNVRKLGNFLGKELTAAEVDEIVYSSSFCQMEKMQSISPLISSSSSPHHPPASNNDQSAFKFLRCGKVEQWKEYFTVDLLEKVDQWMRRNLSKKELQGLTF